MKSTNITGLALSLGLLFALSCKKNTSQADQNSSVKAFSEYLGKPIILDLKGKVYDRDENPVDSAIVSVGDTSVFTNNKGYFTIKNVSAHENLLTINVTKKDYKNEQIIIAPKKDSTMVDITIYSNDELSLFWFSKYNHNLPQSAVK